MSKAKKAAKKAAKEAKRKQAVNHPTAKQQAKKDAYEKKRDANLEAKKSKLEDNKSKPIQLMTDDQQKLMSVLSQLGQGQAQSLYPQMFGDAQGNFPQGGGFQGIADQAGAGFEQNSMPTIADRFTNFSDSSQFGDIASAQGQGLQLDLEAMQSQYDQTQLGQQQQLLSTLLSSGLQRQFEPVMQQMGDNPWSGLSGQLGGAAISRMPGMNFGFKGGK